MRLPAGMTEKISDGNFRSRLFVDFFPIFRVSGQDALSSQFWHPSLGAVVQSYLTALEYLQGTSGTRIDSRLEKREREGKLEECLQAGHKLRTAEHREWSLKRHGAFGLLSVCRVEPRTSSSRP